MAPKKNNRAVVVGMFIFIGVAILMVAIFTLGGQKKTFAKTFPVHAIFNDISGLQSGGNIWFSGVKVGTVKEIKFHGESQVLVTMNLEKVAQTHIRKDAKVKISSDGLIGNKIIVIYGGTPSTPNVGEDDYLSIENALSTDDMMATLQTTNKNLETITNDFKSISKKIDSGQGSLGMLINDPTMAIKLNATVTDLQTSVGNFKVASQSSKLIAADFEAFANKMNNPGNSIHDFVSDTLLFHRVYNGVSATLTQLEKTATSANSFASNLNAMSAKLNQKDSPVGVLLNDPAAAASIQETLNNLETTTEKLDENMEALQHNFLFRRYFKKKAKGKLD